MSNRNRLEQLHALAAQLARLPESPDRDRMLTEVRIRAVDVETGVVPGPMRPLEPDAAISATEVAGRYPAKVSGTHRRRAARPRPESPAETTQVERHSRSAAQGSVAAGAPSIEIAAPAGADRLEPSSEPRGDDRVDLLEEGGVLFLGDLPAEYPASDALVSSPPWARGLRG